MVGKWCSFGNTNFWETLWGIMCTMDAEGSSQCDCKELVGLGMALSFCEGRETLGVLWAHGCGLVHMSMLALQPASQMKTLSLREVRQFVQGP